MSDIVERLRKPMVAGMTHPIDAERAEAADEIERLTAELDEEERAVFAAMKMLKERDAEIERLRALLTAMRESVYEQPIGVWFGAISRALER